VARAALDRADKSKRRDKRASEPTAETREFWETWAESKTTHEPTPAAEAAPEESERPRERGRERTRDRDKDKTRGRDKREAKSDKSDKSDKHAKHDKKDDSGRGKREAAPSADGGQVRLFVSLGKKHGVSADDLRTLLAGAVGGDTARIGSVSLRDSHAHVRVPEDLADAIIARIHGTAHGEHSVTVERSRS
jgi:hypothetical protein